MQNRLIENDIIDLIRNEGKPVTASEIAKTLDVSKTEVNSILYKMENRLLKKSETVPPYWGMQALEEQVIHSLSEYPMTAVEIAEELRVSKSAVNSILYSLEGKVACHDDDKRPGWYLIEHND